MTTLAAGVAAHAASLRLQGRWAQAVRLLARHGDPALPALAAAHIDLFHWSRAWWSRAADVSIRALSTAATPAARARAASDAAHLAYLQAYQRDDLRQAGVGARLEAAAHDLGWDEGDPPVPDPAGEVVDLRGLLVFRVGLYREHVEGDLERARRTFAVAHRLAERSSDRLLLASTHRHLGTTGYRLGDEHGAVRDFVLSLRHREATGWLPGQVPALLSLAALSASDGTRRQDLLHRAHRIGAELRWPPLVRSMVRAGRHLPVPDDFSLR